MLNLAQHRLLTLAEQVAQADVVLVDVGAINRSAIIAADHVVIPLAPDLFSAQGLQNLGPRLRTWRTEWHERITRNPASDLPLPSGDMHPAGYVLLGHGLRLGRPVQAYERWMARIPSVIGRRCSRWMRRSRSSRTICTAWLNSSTTGASCRCRTRLTSRCST
jgi:hypothetical protein